MLCACQTTKTTPNSNRLAQVKSMRLTDVSDEMRTQHLEIGQPTFIRIFKEEKILETWIQDTQTKRYFPYKQFPICKFSGRLGPKLAEGDGQAPEGFYEVNAQQLNPWSKYHLSFNLGFPNTYDRARLRTGSNIMVHGGCKSIGCYAITDKAMEEVYLMTEAAIANGHTVPVHIFPFRMTLQKMFETKHSRWRDEWANLRQGYDAFERTKIPPKPIFKNYKYAFGQQDFEAALY